MAPERTHRNTPQRHVVLEELKRLSSHPTAAELFEITRRRMPKISLGTVYRNLEFLARNGTIQKLETGGAQARFDGDPRRHHHARCMECGRVDDVPGLPDDFVRAEALNLGGYEILGFRLEFIGVCPRCHNGATAEVGETSSDDKARA